MTGLAQRLLADELMDAGDLDPATYTAVVGDLAKVNTVTLAARPTLDFLARARRRQPLLRVLDVGFGDGDMLRRIARWAQRRGVTVELTGVDLNPRSEQAARAHTPPELAIQWITGDYATLGGGAWDVVISSLVAHHMSDAELVSFIRWMTTHARSGWLINDLERNGFAHWGFPLLARVAGWHRIVRLDGTTSIARSYIPSEWRPILVAAGAADARVYRTFPFRLCVEQLR